MSNQITRWNPLREMSAMQSALDRMFEDTWRPFFEVTSLNNLALDVDETDKAYIVVTELPGVKADNIEVKLDGDQLMINAEIPERIVSEEGTRSLLRERRYGQMSRRVRLPMPVDEEHIEAVYENGVLTLTLPKSEAAQPRTIPVKISQSK